MRGRFFTETQDASKAGVVVINQALAQKYFSGEDPIGRRIADYEGGRPSEREIVGVVADVREGPLDSDIWPAEYFSINETQDSYFSLTVRTRQDAGAMLPLLVSALHQIDPGLGAFHEMTMNEQIDGHANGTAAPFFRVAGWRIRSYGTDSRNCWALWSGGVFG